MSAARLSAEFRGVSRARWPSRAGAMRRRFSISSASLPLRCDAERSAESTGDAAEHLGRHRPSCRLQRRSSSISPVGDRSSRDRTSMLSLCVASIALSIAPLRASIIPSRAAVALSDTDDMAKPDPKFGNDELARTWERTGKGKRRWQPGDETGDPRDDARLLCTAWKLTPPRLVVGGDDCAASNKARLVLTYVGLPYACEAATAEQAAPALFGNGVGVDGAGVEGVEAICEFAKETGEFFAITMGAISPIAAASGRDDIGAWVSAAAASSSAADAAPLLEQLPGMLRGVGKRGLACLNEEGGFSMDDAEVLVALSGLARAHGTDGWPAPAVRYLEEGPAGAAGILA